MTSQTLKQNSNGAEPVGASESLKLTVSVEQSSQFPQEYKEKKMNAIQKVTGMDMKVKLSLLWIFFMFNTAYIDITTLYYSVFINHTPKVQYTQVFLLGAAVLVEIPMAMVLLSRILPRRANRWTNIIVGLFLTAVQIVTLFVGTPTLPYAFLSVILIATSALIVWYAWRWPNDVTAISRQAAESTRDGLSGDRVDVTSAALRS